MSSRPLWTLGNMSIKDMQAVVISATDKVSTTEVRSSSGMDIDAQQNVTVESKSGDLKLEAPAGKIFVGNDLDVQGVIGNPASDSLNFSCKAIALNATDAPTDANASGSGLYVCGKDFADFLNTSGGTGSKDSISMTWRTDDGGVWSLKGGNLSFSKPISTGDVCKYTFNITDSGDLILQRTIGTDVTQSLAYWETMA